MDEPVVHRRENHEPPYRRQQRAHERARPPGLADQEALEEDRHRHDHERPVVGDDVQLLAPAAYISTGPRTPYAISSFSKRGHLTPE